MSHGCSKRYVHIGGDEGAGQSQWEGEEVKDGWEMKIAVHAGGRVSGGNENKGQEGHKRYTGYFFHGGCCGDGAHLVAHVESGEFAGTTTNYIGSIDKQGLFTGAVEIIECADADWVGAKGSMSGRVITVETPDHDFTDHDPYLC